MLRPAAQTIIRLSSLVLKRRQCSALFLQGLLYAPTLEAFLPMSHVLDHGGTKCCLEHVPNSRAPRSLRTDVPHGEVIIDLCSPSIFQTSQQATLNTS